MQVVGSLCLLVVVLSACGGYIDVWEDSDTKFVVDLCCSLGGATWVLGCSQSIAAPSPLEVALDLDP